MAAGRPFLETCGSYRNFDLRNVWLSRCYNCDDVALWIYDRLVWPCCGEAPLPNTDLPRDIIDDYNEASSILDLSPRGAAALLRLALQKLCKELGESGKDINADIAALVKRGLDVKVAQALDIVRVVGNCSVHPGQIDMKDNRETAEKLFRLINLIAERMISEPKHVNELFDSLPEPQRKAIQARDSMNRP
ncbi:MAG: DUF4145 domain-containing protein [Alphaproteobacteria bacterium]|nr:DUF4145 domain-containing protein [Alphaproteobacteria bacterium]